MSRHTYFPIVVALLIAIAALGRSENARAATPSGVIWVSPSTSAVQPGDYFALDLQIDANEPFNAASASVVLTGSAVRVEGVNGNFLSACPVATYPKIALPNDLSFSATFNPAPTHCVMYRMLVRALSDGAATFTVTNGSVTSAADGSQIFQKAVSATVTVGSGPTTQAPAFTSAGNATFANGTNNSFTVTATGSPQPQLSLQPGDVLPNGVSFNPATGALSGVPGPGAQGVYTLHFLANNGVNPAATQTFMLNVTGGTPPPPPPAAKTATIYAYPNGGTYHVGDRFTVGVYLSGGGQQYERAQGTISLSPNLVMDAPPIVLNGPGGGCGTASFSPSAYPVTVCPPLSNAPGAHQGGNGSCLDWMPGTNQGVFELLGPSGQTLPGPAIGPASQGSLDFQLTGRSSDEPANRLGPDCSVGFFTLRAVGQGPGQLSITNASAFQWSGLNFAETPVLKATVDANFSIVP